jgi:hypothetical protein
MEGSSPRLLQPQTSVGGRNGRFSTSGVVGVYWMTSIISLRKITLPGVVAMFLPMTNLS